MFLPHKSEVLVILENTEMNGFVPEVNESFAKHGDKCQEVDSIRQEGEEASEVQSPLLQDRAVR